MFCTARKERNHNFLNSIQSEALQSNFKALLHSIVKAAGGCFVMRHPTEPDGTQAAR